MRPCPRLDAPGLLDAIRFLYDPPDTLLETNGILFHPRAESLDHLRDIRRAWFDHSGTTLHVSHLFEALTAWYALTYDDRARTRHPPDAIAQPQHQRHRCSGAARDRSRRSRAAWFALARSPGELCVHFNTMDALDALDAPRAHRVFPLVELS